MLLGIRPPGTWSEHVHAWALSSRSDTLVVRYEDLAVHDPATLTAIGDFIDRPQITQEPIAFLQMQESAPTFFHRGSNLLNIAELSGRFPALYNALHGHVAKLMGYPLADVENKFGRLATEYEMLKSAARRPE